MDEIENLLQEIDILHNKMKQQHIDEIMTTYWHVYSICMIFALCKHIYKSQSWKTKHNYTAHEILFILFISLYLPSPHN